MPRLACVLRKAAPGSDTGTVESTGEKRIKSMAQANILLYNGSCCVISDSILTNLSNVVAFRQRGAATPIHVHIGRVRLTYARHASVQM